METCYANEVIKMREEVERKNIKVKAKVRIKINNL